MIRRFGNQSTLWILSLAFSDWYASTHFFGGQVNFWCIWNSIKGNEYWMFFFCVPVLFCFFLSVKFQHQTPNTMPCLPDNVDSHYDKHISCLDLHRLVSTTYSRSWEILHFWKINLYCLAGRAQSLSQITTIQMGPLKRNQRPIIQPTSSLVKGPL